MSDNEIQEKTVNFHNRVITLYQNSVRTKVGGSWSGDQACILESEGRDMAVFFPCVLEDRLDRQEILEKIVAYAERGYMADKDHTGGEYIEVDTPEVWDSTVKYKGSVYLSHSNHPVGHTNEPSQPSSSFVGSCKKYTDSIKLVRDLSFISECANYLIETVDRPAHAKMVRMRKTMIKKSAHVQSICAVSPSLHSTIGIILNRRSGSHRDTTDAKDSWAVMFVLGDFEGGEAELEIGGVKVTSRFQTGDAIVLRARHVTHAIKDWVGTLRATIVYYTQDSVWREYKEFQEREDD